MAVNPPTARPSVAIWNVRSTSTPAVRERLRTSPTWTGSRRQSASHSHWRFLRPARAAYGCRRGRAEALVAALGGVTPLDGKSSQVINRSLKPNPLYGIVPAPERAAAVDEPSTRVAQEGREFSRFRWRSRPPFRFRPARPPSSRTLLSAARSALARVPSSVPRSPAAVRAQRSRARRSAQARARSSARRRRRSPSAAAGNGPTTITATGSASPSTEGGSSVSGVAPLDGKSLILLKAVFVGVRTFNKPAFHGSDREVAVKMQERRAILGARRHGKEGQRGEGHRQ